MRLQHIYVTLMSRFRKTYTRLIFIKLFINKNHFHSFYYELIYADARMISFVYYKNNSSCAV